MTAIVRAFQADLIPARRLADALGIPVQGIDHHVLPDGESLPNVGRALAPTVLIYAAMDRPDPKLMPLILACDAFRRAGVSRLVLVVPYLPYMRQDAVFSPGQPLSCDVFGALLGPRFDRIVTVQPHLHRTWDLTPVFAGTPVTVLSPAELLARFIGRRGEPVIVGPDAESDPWAAAVAKGLGSSYFSLTKHRLNDRAVELRLPRDIHVEGRRVVLVDDICSTGCTLMAAVKALRTSAAKSVEIAVVHALSARDVLTRLRETGAKSMVSTDSCVHPTNKIHLAPLLASALAEELQ